MNKMGWWQSQEAKLAKKSNINTFGVVKNGPKGIAGWKTWRKHSKYSENGKNVLKAANTTNKKENKCPKVAINIS